MTGTFIADLHIHSKYSRATSPKADLFHLHQWAQRKGIRVVGTGDFTHPGWFAELTDQLVPAESGLFRLRDDLAAEAERQVPAACRGPVRFMLEVEISNIYKKGDRVRKVHNLVYMPSLDAAAQFDEALGRVGNIKSDGRPILGLDSRSLLEMVLETDDDAYLIPAHIWTPWFSVLGSKSGFDRIEDCYEDLSDHIFAAETGLSSDPAMNWRLSGLDRYCLVSNSDAHSPSKLAREANLFSCDLSYAAIKSAMQTRQGFEGTIEFFPDEGKYHLDGHRKCGVRLTPAQARELGGICPVCGKKVTIGVLHRVEELADRPDGARPDDASDYTSLVGLAELVGEVLGRGPQTKGVLRICEDLLDRIGPELSILQDIPEDDLERVAGDLVAEAVGRVRRGQVIKEAGFDGQYGRIRVFARDEQSELSGQGSLFAVDPTQSDANATQPPSPAVTTTMPLFEAATKGEGPVRDAGPGMIRPGDPGDHGDVHIAAKGPNESTAHRPARLVANDTAESPADPADLTAGLTDEQAEAVTHPPGPLCIVAGPGTGKTRVLTSRIAYRIQQGTDPASILAVTFTNKAAQSLAHRLSLLAGAASDQVRVATFHGFCMGLLHDQGERFGLDGPLKIADRRTGLGLLDLVRPELPAGRRQDVLDLVSRLKRSMIPFQDWTAAAVGFDANGATHDPNDAAHDPNDAARVANDAARVANDAARVAERRDAALAYQRELDRLHLLDLDDLVTVPVRVMTKDSELVSELRHRFAHLFVDEYQDTSPVQERLVELLGPDDADVTVIGDPDQSIYGFRGADPEAIKRFVTRRPSATRLSLDRSFRTPDLVLDAASRLLEPDDLFPPGNQRSKTQQPGNQRSKAQQPHDRVWSRIEFAGGKIPVALLPTEKAEAEFVVARLEHLVGGTGFFSMDSGRTSGHAEEQVASLSDVAVLFRLNSQVETLTEAFDRSGIPYDVAVSGAELSPRADLVVATLRLATEPSSHLFRYEAFRAADRVAGTQDAVGSLATNQGRRATDDARQPKPIATELTQAATASAATTGPSKRTRRTSRKKLVAAARGGRLKPAFSLVRSVARTLAREVRAQASDPEASSVLVVRCAELLWPDRPQGLDLRGPVLAELSPMTRDLDLNGFLHRVCLLGPQDGWHPNAERVHLMTFHAAKGLEFPVVFLVGLNEGIVPLVRQGTSDLAEERRLLYVAMTRASRHLILSGAKKRRIQGRIQPVRLSPLLSEFESLAESEANALPKRRNRPRADQLTLF